MRHVLRGERIAKNRTLMGFSRATRTCVERTRFLGPLTRKTAPPPAHSSFAALANIIVSRRD